MVIMINCLFFYLFIYLFGVYVSNGVGGVGVEDPLLFLKNVVLEMIPFRRIAACWNLIIYFLYMYVFLNLYISN